MAAAAEEKTQTVSEKSLRRWFGSQNISGRGAKLPALPLAAVVFDGERRQMQISPGALRSSTHQLFQEDGCQG